LSVARGAESSCIPCTGHVPPLLPVHDSPLCSPTLLATCILSRTRMMCAVHLTVLCLRRRCRVGHQLTSMTLVMRARAKKVLRHLLTAGPVLV
jgi:hypothetical protein